MKNKLVSFLLLTSISLAAQPVAVNDAVETTQGAAFTLISIGVVQNDIAPAGEALRIHSIVQPTSGIATFSNDSIQFRTRTFSGFFGKDSLQYRVCLISDSTIVSGWATVRINILTDSLHIMTSPDHGEANLGLWALFDVLANDLNPGNNPITLTLKDFNSTLGSVTVDNSNPVHPILRVKPLVPDTTLTILYAANGGTSAWFMVIDTLYISIKMGHAVEKFSINNICTYINADAMPFGSRYVSAAFGTDESPHCYEVPSGSGKGTFYTVSPWMGGMALDGTIHLAAERYRGLGQDFYAGPVSNPASYIQQPDSVTHRVYYLTNEDILYHLSHFNEAGYTPIWSIANWPGNGDTTLGQSKKLASFKDMNDNGLYEPLLGDCPVIRGDASAFYIFNDACCQHTESGGMPMQAEFHCMVFAFDRPDDSLLHNTLFIHYDIYNRSDSQFNNTMFGLWSDVDLGDGSDDFIGTDVTNGFFYAYNANLTDGHGQSYAYGSNPPMQSVAFLGGALMDPDGQDNPKIDNLGTPVCGEAINGLGFGDGTADNERMGMTNSIFSVTPFGSGTPVNPTWFYNALRSHNEDGTPMLFGGQGTTATGASGPAARFIFPGETDPLNWGTGCQSPNTTEIWTEKTAGSSTNQDRRGGASTGPFTFKPGDCQQIDLALVTTWNTANPDPLASLGKMQQYVATLRTCFEADSVPGGGTFSGHDVGIAKPQQKPTTNLVVYPNPAGDYIIVSGVQGQGKADYQISDITGKILVTGTFSSQSFKIDTSSLNAGLYILTLTTQQSRGYCKFIRDQRTFAIQTEKNLSDRKFESFPVYLFVNQKIEQMIAGKLHWYNGSQMWLLILFTVMVSPLQSQPAGTRAIKGRVSDQNNGQPIPFASVAVYSLPDTTLITGTITDAEGAFELRRLPKATLLLKAGFVGYRNAFQTLQPNESRPVNLILSTASATLEGIEITATATGKQSSIEKTKISLEGNLSASTGNMSQVLASQPNITLDNDQNLYIRGNKNVLLLIDGIPTTIGSLLNIPASLVESVEIITNPDVRFDSEGTGGIVNLTTRKPAGNVASAAITLNMSSMQRVNGGLNLRLPGKKLNWNLGYNGSFMKDEIKSSLERVIPSESIRYDQAIETEKSEHLHAFNVGAVYAFRKKKASFQAICGSVSRNLATNKRSRDSDSTTQWLSHSQNVATIFSIPG